MCGIAGIVKFGAGAEGAPWVRGDVTALRRMSELLAHRGPDGEGLWTDPRAGKGGRGAAALVHRRLAIIDRPGGGQPMGNEDGTVQVVFNGEIYNHAVLRRELQSAGHRFKSDHSDTEVLVHGWEEWGMELPARLLGMFTFAVWDTRSDTLFLARDRMGQKPLFYAPLEDGIVFGSTIGSVLAWPEVPRRVPRELLALYFQYGFIPLPQTIYRDVSQVSPGHWLRLRGEVLDGDRFWPRSVPGENRKSKIENSGDSLRTELSRAVESQLIADVPIACFLSGGIDSSIVAALMQEAVRRAGGEPIRTVSVGFAESGFDETAYAAEVARKIGSHHTRLEVNARQGVMETLERLMERSLGQPFADSSIVPTYQLSKAVRGLAPVALSGDGADELFGGYDRYRAMALLERWAGVARWMPRSIGGQRERYRRLSAAAREADVAERYTRLLEIFPPDTVNDLLNDSAPPTQDAAHSTQHSALRYAMLRDQGEYLPGDVLWKVDSASMLEALEVRSPFLDHHVVELANALEDATLVRAGRGKALLRETFAGELPPEVQARGKKGFGVPIGEWFKGELRGALTDLLFAADSFTTTHLRKEVARRLLDEHLSGARDHTHRLFALLMLELWAKQFSPTVEP